MDDDPTDRASNALRGSPYLNTDQAAHFLSLSRRTLQEYRTSGTGPAWRRHSRIVQYHIDDLIAWSEARATRPRP
jgi:hypothetical protein